jgi:nucleotide-binding universal stress UspA family protein
MTADKGVISMYNNILVPLDGSETSEQALAYARLVAGPLVAKVQLVRVYSTPPAELSEPSRGIYLDQVSETSRNLAEDYLREKAGQLSEAGLSVVTSVLEGDAATVIVDEAEKQPETLIVMSTHGRSGITRWTMGSVTDKVLRASGYPILIIPSTETVLPDHEAGLEGFIVALDGSTMAEQVLPHSIALSRALSVGITLVRAIPSAAEYLGYMDYPMPNYDELYQQLVDDARQYLETMKSQVDGLGVPRVEARLVYGNAAEAIHQSAREMPGSAVAMTTHGRSGLGRWVLGSVADRVVRHAEGPVLLVRAFEA